MSRFRDWKLECKVYIGDLGHGAAKQELEEMFEKYGRLRNVWVARNPPGFAFVEFEDPRDAQDAVRALDGTMIKGRRVIVEMSSGRSRSNRRPPPPSRRYGGGGGGGRYGSPPRGGRRRSRSYSPKRSRSRSRSPYYGGRSSRSPERTRRDSSRDRD